MIKKSKINVNAKIEHMEYKPFLCKELPVFDYDEFEKAINEQSAFLLKTPDGKKIAISTWVSAKRTRSYPFARVYNTLDFDGRRVTIIPIFKDEGADGDRDFLQWDTISLMSLLRIDVIIAYYDDAIKNPRYKNKITSQRFNLKHIQEQLFRLGRYQSDPLHWNMQQIKNISELGLKAISAYQNVSNKTGVKMTSSDTAKSRFDKIAQDGRNFLENSRNMAEKAQQRESITIQPKEKLSGVKGMITISNYLGGLYYWTCDEVEIKNRTISLIEGKHSRREHLPSLDDIKDGLLKIILYSNLNTVKVDGIELKVEPELKLTTEKKLNLSELSKSQKNTLQKLLLESKTNGIKVKINDDYLHELL